MIDFKPTKAVDESQKLSHGSRRVAWFAGVALLATLGSGVAWHYLPRTAAPAASAAAAPAAIPVSVATVEQRDTAIWNDFSGRVKAVGRVEIRPRAAGAIVAAQFREGSIVKQDDLLFTIDPAPYAVEVQRAAAQVVAATARLELAAAPSTCRSDVAIGRDQDGALVVTSKLRHR